LPAESEDVSHRAQGSTATQVVVETAGQPCRRAGEAFSLRQVYAAAAWGIVG
jgi:hypothetical protein